MTMSRMFCPLHTPAEKHACTFDYQVGHQEYLYLLWLDGNDIGDFYIDFLNKRVRQETRLRRGTQRCDGLYKFSSSALCKTIQLDN